jgi:ubiquinone/menaquinone biosynthesis C-methylase UbiE
VGAWFERDGGIQEDRMSKEAPDTRAYFEHVMDDWQPRQAVAHPYAENLSWQRNYTLLRRWLANFDLQNGRVLEVGCGTGLLQDLAPNYVGVDIAASSAQYMHQPFCTCSATTLPFADNTFDAVWTFWVLEHVDHPQAMLDEIRRVLKPGGGAFICAAFAVEPWVSQGLHKRPWGDLTPRQQLNKLTIPLRSSVPYKIVTTLPLRVYDLLQYMRQRQPTTLRYRPLQPNYETYWDYDADACASLDSYSVALYFLSRGDTSYYGLGPVRSLLRRSRPQAYVVRK